MQIQPTLIYLTRKEWGANTSIPRLGASVPRSERTQAIVHHTVIVDNDATKNLWTNLAEVKAKMRQLQTIRPDLGMDAPYNFVMFLMEDGTIVVCEGRGLDRSGAHTKGHNYKGMATALQGNFMLPIDLSAYIPGMSRWWGWLRYDQGMDNLGSEHPGAIAYGHRDFRDPNDTSTWTSCPGDYLYNIIPQLTFQAATELPPEPIEEELTMCKHVASPHHTGMEMLGMKREFPNQEQHKAVHAMGYKDTPITDAEWDAMPSFFGEIKKTCGGESGASAKEVADELSRRLTG